MNHTPEQASGADRLNYFNYFTEVEEEFVRRRGKPLLVSPLDWALIESWKNAGIPLHVVLRAINKSFDSYDARPRKYRKVNSIFYCQQEVEASFAEYRLAQVGGGTADDAAQSGKAPAAPSADRQAVEPFPRPLLLAFLSRSEAELQAAALVAQESGRGEIENAAGRARARLRQIAAEVESLQAINAEAIEHDLDAIDRMLLAGARHDIGGEGVARLREEAEAQLKAYRKKMDKAIYEQTLENFVARRLRESNGLPRLSLFYL
ncbi:MAG TPA: hypothetical protein VJZ91_12000 [Blastocatellia bacterium]|nr:hypothetical protein [Blastocatellia bacterium]